MIDIKTDYHFRDLTKKEMTRGGFLKGILASGIAPSITLATLANTGSANATVGGMMRNVGARNTARFGVGGWKNPYITDGLIGMWDAEWNEAGGKHNPSLMKLTDLIGTNDIVLPDTATLSEKCVSLVESNVWSNESITKQCYTIDCVFSYSGVYYGGNSGLIGICSRNQIYDPYPLVQQRSSYIGWGWSTVYYPYNFPIILTNTPFNAAFTASGLKHMMFFEGSNYRSKDEIRLFATGKLVIGSDGWRWSNCSIYSIRLYTRVLSDTEIANNYAIDKARFNLP